MADIESNIRFGVDTSDAIASIKMLQAQISAFQKQMASSSVANAESARKLRRGLIDDLNATGQWSASIKTIKSTSDSFTNALEKNKLSMGDYFRFGASQVTGFRNIFSKEFNTIEKVARERVKDLQTQYISLGRDASGSLKAIAVRPLRLDMESLATQTAMNAQRQQIFNQLLKQGSTNLLNFGKNTQWAGRQLMVGFTIPLSIFGNMASKTFMELEEQAIRFKRVYGELFTPPEEADQMLETLKELGKEFTKYGVAVEKTLGLAADAAAMGKTGTDLLDQVTEANRLAVLGSVDQQQALETTISLTNAFGIASEDLAKKIDFLNAVENQTVVSIEDLTIAIPKAGPVVQQLGGDVEDLAFFLTAMKEGGINASEGANALKSGLASLINPTDQAANMLKVFGINIRDLVAQSRGDVKKLVIDFATALDTLDPSQRAQAIEQLFGKFQFSRLSTLFQNVIQEGTQASRVLELTNATTQELAQLSSKELKRVEESTTFRFRKAIEEFQLAIAPVGEEFLKLITPIIEFATKIIERFNSLSDGAKSFITGLIVLLGAVGPVALMTFGLLANGVANIIKGFTFVRELFLRTGNQSSILGQQFDYLTTEQLQASAVAASLDQVHQKLIQTFSSEAGAVQNLANTYRRAFTEQQRFDTGRRIAQQSGMKLASGILSVPGPKGAGDIVPAMLSPGEAVIPADKAKKYGPLIQGIVADNIPGFQLGNVEKQSTYQLGHLQMTKEVLPSGERVMGSFVRVMTAKQNKALDKLGQTAEQFAMEWNKVTDGLARTIELGGESLTEEIMQAGREIENEIRDTAIDLAKTRGTLINDALVAEASDITLQKNISRGGAGARAAQALTRTKDMDIVARATASGLKESEVLKQAGIVFGKETYNQVVRELEAKGLLRKIITAGGRESWVTTEAGAGLVAGEGAGANFARANRRGSAVPQGRRSSGVSYLDLQGRVGPAIIDAIGQDVKNAALVRSPSKKTTQASQGMVTGVTETLRKGKAPVTNATNDLVNEAIVKPIKIGARRASSNPALMAMGGDQQTQAAILQGTRRKRAGGAVVGGQTVRFNPNIAGNAQAAIAAAQERQTSAMQMSNQAMMQQNRVVRAGSEGLSRMNSVIMNGTFAISSLSGILSLFGGQFAELSSTIFTVSTALFSLMAVTEMLTKVKIAERIASAREVAFGPLVGPKTQAQAAGGFAGTIGKLTTFFTKLISPIGLVVLGLTALAGIIAFMVGEEEKAKQRIAGLGDAAFLSAEKMKKAADLLGFTAKTTAFGQNITAGTAAATGADQAGLISTLRGSEDFKTSFATEIEALKNASRQDAEMVLKSAANQLFAAGATKEQVDAYVKALAQEAGQTTLNFSFTGLDFTKGGKDAIVKAAQDATNTFSETFEKGLTATNQTVAKGAVGVFASSFQALKDGLANNIMSAEDFNTGLASVVTSLESLSAEELKFVLPNLYSMLGLEETMKDIPNVKDQLLLLQADAAGISITKDQKEALKNSEKSATAARAALRVRKQINDQLKVEAQLQIQNKTIAEQREVIDEQIGAATAQLNDRTVALTNQREAYDILISQGYDVATAFEIAGDATLAAGIKSAAAAGMASQGWKDFEKFLQGFLEAQKKAPVGGGGAGTKSPFEEATEALKKQRKEIINSSVAFTKLRKAGLDTASAMRAAEDPILAAAVASSKVDTKKWRELLDLINKVDKISTKQQINQALREGKINRERTLAFAKMSSTLQTLGLESEDIQNIMSDELWGPKFAEDFMKDGVLNTTDVLNKIEQIKMQKSADFILNIQTKEGAAEEFQKSYDKVVGSLEADKQVIEINFQAETEGLNIIAREAENLIAEIQYRIDDYEAELTGIEEQEELINQKYDERRKALDELAKANESISRQQRSQLTLADALSQGDIAAAARAVQEIRAQQAQDRLAKQGDQLELSKEKELAALRSKNGRSRTEIEQAIKKLKKDIFIIEEETLEKTREDIRLATVRKERRLDAINSEILRWEVLSALVNQAKLKLTDEEKKAMEDQAKLITDLITKWDTIKDKEAFLKITKVTKEETAGGGPAAGGPAAGRPAAGGEPGAGGGDGGDAIPVTPLQAFKDSGMSISGFIKQIDSKAEDALRQANVAASTAAFNKSGLSVAGFIKKVDSVAEKNAATAAKVAATTAAFKQTGLSLSAYVNKDASKPGISSYNTFGAKRYADGGRVVKYLRMGGLLPYKAEGGSIFKPLGTDTVPAMLTPGEFVVRKYAVENFGLDRLKAINSGTYNGDSMYNYEVNVNVQTDANPDQIARAVMGQIKQIESQRIRGNRF